MCRPDYYYSGTIEVRHTNEVYQLTMNYGTSEESRGTGGQYDSNVMFVVFQDKKNPKNIGLEQYSFNAEKTAIQGFWVYLGKDKLGTEICKKVK